MESGKKLSRQRLEAESEREVEQLTEEFHNIDEIDDLNQVDVAIVRALVANGISYSVIQNPDFLKMIKAINSAPKGYKPPSIDRARASFIRIRREFGDARYENRERICYTRDELLQLREVAVVPDAILKCKREVDSDFLPEEQGYNRAETNVKAKTITEIHSEAEKNLGLRPGATASIRNPRGILSPQGSLSPGGFPGYRPGTGGMMPGMPGARKMPGMPGMDNDNWEVPRSRSMQRGVDVNASAGARSPFIGRPAQFNSKLLPQGNGGIISGKTSALLQGSGPPARQSSFSSGMEPLGQIANAKPIPTPQSLAAIEKPAPAATANVNLEGLKRKTISILEEYFNIRLQDEALQCIEELKSPSYHSEIVREAINLGLEKNPPCVEPVTNLLEYLFSKKVFTARDISSGCLLYGGMIDDIAIDLPKAPNNFGEILGKLIQCGGLNFSIMKQVLQKVEDEMFRKLIIENAVKLVEPGVLEVQAADVEAICQFLNTIGKQLDENPSSRRINDMYMSRLKELSSNSQLAPRLRFMVRDVLDLRTNNWVPRCEEVRSVVQLTKEFHNIEEIDDLDQVDIAIVRALVANGISYSVLQNPDFLKMVIAINNAPKGYKPLSIDRARTSFTRIQREYSKQKFGLGGDPNTAKSMNCFVYR
ncbi:unnamed protein product [Amaranthus hypochondriacus]